MKSMEQKNYRVIRSSRKTVAIQIMPDGEVVVRAPMRMPATAIHRFVEEKQGWIEKHRPTKGELLPKFTKTELDELTKQAKVRIPERVEHFAKLLGVTYGTVTIRCQHTRWGSCSKTGNLNFNGLLMLMPEEVINYVVVHELCHRKEMNHSPAFWMEVRQILPNCLQSKRWLKENGQALIGRLP